MAELKLIYFEGCPNAEKVRKRLMATGYSFGVVRQDDLPANHPLRAYSSPTILKGTNIVFGSATGSHEGGCSLNLPTASELMTRLAGKNDKKRAGILAPVGSIGSAITVGFCPICLPAVGAFLSAIGLGFLVREAVLKPVLIVFLVATVAGLLWSYIKEHRNLGPLVTGVMMSAGLYVGRYVYLGIKFNQILMYGSIAGIVAVSVWNLRLRKSRSCAVCVPAGVESAPDQEAAE